MSSSQNVPITEMVQLAVELGTRYLAAGGPTSRLEERLSATAREFEIFLDVFSTPTGIFVTGQDLNRQSPITIVARIDKAATDLTELVRLEQLLEQLVDHKIGLQEALFELKQPRPEIKGLASLFYRSSFFLLGFGGSFSAYGSWTAAFWSGVICFLFGFLISSLGERWGWSGIFRNFAGCFGALIISGFLSQWLGLPADAMVLGILLLIVPGLSITTAISELADHNFVSGTAKLMKSFLILLAMGIAFLLANDLATWFFPGIEFYRWGLQEEQPTWVQLLGHALVIGSFSGVFFAPYRYIPFALLPGYLSWWVFRVFNFSDVVVLGSFLPALTVGFVSFALSRWLRVPSQIFTVPGILSLVPGMLALSSFTVMSSPTGSESGAIFLQAMIVAGSIVFGLLTARVPFTFIRWHAPKGREY